MNPPEFYEQWIAMQQAQLLMLERIAIALERLTPTKAPEYQKSLSDYRHFDWSTIGAKVVHADQDGAAIVEWNGQQYSRRSPQNKFGAAIWYSRAIGKDEDGNTAYERLITFKQLAEVDPLPQRMLSSLQ